jgi:hypothetical protein
MTRACPFRKPRPTLFMRPDARIDGAVRQPLEMRRPPLFRATLGCSVCYSGSDGDTPDPRCGVNWRPTPELDPTSCAASDWNCWWAVRTSNPGPTGQKPGAALEKLCNYAKFHRVGSPGLRAMAGDGPQEDPTRAGAAPASTSFNEASPRGLAAQPNPETSSQRRGDGVFGRGPPRARAWRPHPKR